VKTQSQFLHEILAALEQFEVAYMVSGSISSTYYGRPRSTQDVDIVVQGDRGKLKALAQSLLAKGFYLDEESVDEALARHTLFNVLDPSSGYKADLIIRKDRPFSVEEFRRRRKVSVLGSELFMVTAEDAILSKLEWSKEGPSERQFQDALGVAVVQAEHLELHYLRKWARALDIEELLARLLTEMKKYSSAE
jgi:hypothetical protein